MQVGPRTLNRGYAKELGLCGGRFISNGMIKCMLKIQTKTIVDDFGREEIETKLSAQQKKRQNKVRTGELKTKTTEKQ